MKVFSSVSSASSVVERWVLVSPRRNDRPWQGHVDPAPADAAPPFDPICYLCPGNERARGVRNPRYSSTFAFDNDFAALRPQNAEVRTQSSELRTPNAELRTPNPDDDLLVSRSERGVCRVVCFSPRHDLTLARMVTPEIRAVVDRWIDEYASLATMPWVQYALVFENRGPMMGASNPHPHGQIWATETIPNEPAREQEAFARRRSRHGDCLLCAYFGVETRLAERIVCENDAFLAVVPFWAVWPFETLLVSRRHVGAMHELNDTERDALADILRRLITRYDNLFEAPFPYSMGFHQRPIRQTSADDWHLHAHVYPPLLRSATIRKFMVGFELLGSPQRDLTPEDAASRLQAVGEVHYADRTRAGAPR
ncbi:MAG: galactose-1-phosphate uridylyltransferase [Acidobacteria bacterium 13_1_20CM_2_65_9]|nr:MAG: galactose-1-phosphate uridylyltransferase [Acidobacteria bacterium 13_1_20CM_2_65_9]